MSQLLWFTGPSGRRLRIITASGELDGWQQLVRSVNKADLCREEFMLPHCSGTPTWGVRLMDMENLIATLQGNLKNLQFKWSPWPLGQMPPEPSCQLSGIGSQSPSCSQCHSLLSPLPDHPGIRLWLYQEKGLNREEHAWVMSALPSAGLCLILPI